MLNHKRKCVSVCLEQLSTHKLCVSARYISWAWCSMGRVGHGWVGHPQPVIGLYFRYFKGRIS